jgi:hypothetical protein
VDDLQTGGDVIGTLDPTGIVDGLNALVYLVRGHWAEAGLSAISIVPYVGDVVGKGGKCALKGVARAERGRRVAAALGKGKRVVVIGESMATRVRPTAKALGGGFYRARKLNPWDEAVALRRNKRWIRDQMKRGHWFVDIGIDTTRSERSVLYEAEKEVLGDYPNVMRYPCPRTKK